MQTIFFFCVVLLSAMLPPSAYAGTPAPSAFNKFMWTATGGTAESSQILSFSASGSPVLNPVVPQIDTDGGMPRVSTQGQLKNASGRVYDIGASGRIPAGEVAGAVGRFAVRSAGALVVGVALYDLAKELLFIVGRNPDGSLKVEKETPPAPTEFLWRAANYGSATSWGSPGAACHAIQLAYGWTQSTTAVVLHSGTAGTANAKWYCSTWSVYIETAGQARCGTTSVPTSTTTCPAAAEPSTIQDLENAVAAKSGWPTNSNISRVLAEAGTGSEQKLQPEPLTITGPATSQGTTTTTNNTTNNTTKTEVVTYNHTYEGNKVNTTTTTITTTVDNGTGAVIDSTTTTSDPAVAQDPSDKPDPITCGLPDTPICAVKVNEDGTPTEISETEANTKADALKTAQETGLDRMKGTEDTNGWFTDWNLFFSAPAMSACSPVALPGFNGGASMGSIDPCPVVDGVRTVMGYLWAIGGLFLCLGFVRQSVQLG